MARDLKKYYQAWELRQQGKKLLEIGQIMGYKTGERARQMISFIDCKVKNRYLGQSKELKELILKYEKVVY